jgi:hypothetical protein
MSAHDSLSGNTGDNIPVPVNTNYLPSLGETFLEDTDGAFLKVRFFRIWLRIPLTAQLQRKNGIFKKVYELGVLCSVDIAVIVFGPSLPSPFGTVTVADHHASS